MSDKFLTPKLKSIEIKKVKIENPTKKINLIFIIYGIIILISNLIFKVIVFNDNFFNKKSNSTGIKIIRNNFFALPFLLTIINFFISFIVFNYYLKSNYKEEIFNNRYLIFLKKLKFFNLFKNLLLSIFCYLIYSLIYLPIERNFQLKLSGHVLVIFFSSTILMNMSESINVLIANRIASRTFKLFNYVIYLYIFHSGYCLIFTSSKFHYLSECVISMILSIIYINILNFLPLNFILKQLINPNLPRSKLENIISFSN